MSENLEWTPSVDHPLLVGGGGGFLLWRSVLQTGFELSNIIMVPQTGTN